MVGWGRVLGCIASNISVGLTQPGHDPSRRAEGRLGAYRLSHAARCMAASPTAPRRCAAWSRTPTAPSRPTICGASAGRSWSPTPWRTAAACTGLSGAQMAQHETIRGFQARLGSEAIRIGQALGYGSKRSTTCRRRSSPAPAKASPRRSSATRTGSRPTARLGRAAPVDGPGHGEGPPHRDRVPERLCRARGRKDRHCRPAPTNAWSTSSRRSNAANCNRIPAHITDLRLNWPRSTKTAPGVPPAPPNKPTSCRDRNYHASAAAGLARRSGCVAIQLRPRPHRIEHRPIPLLNREAFRERRPRLHLQRPHHAVVPIVTLQNDPHHRRGRGPAMRTLATDRCRQGRSAKPPPDRASSSASTSSTCSPSGPKLFRVSAKITSSSAPGTRYSSLAGSSCRPLGAARAADRWKVSRFGECLAIRNAGLRWRRPIEWTAAMSQFAILFGDRFVLSAR